MIDSFSGSHRFLSNFWPCVISFEGRIYPSTEHAYQAAKSLDDSVRARVAALPSPGSAKAAGRGIVLRPDWLDVRISVMARVTASKYPAGSDLARLLLGTGSAELVEVNRWGDRFWGVCRGVGENRLGRILMDRRALLRLTDH